MGNKQVIIFSIAIFLAIPLILATGLQVSPQTLEVNKTQGINYFINLTFTNEESFDMWNIQADEDIIKMAEIKKLEPSQSITVKANITRDDEFDGEITFIQFKNVTLGSLNETYLVDVDFIDGIDPCDLVLVKGDSIKWINKVADDVVLRNYDTQNDITTINEGDNYTMKFTSPEKFKYYFLRRGVPFGGVCEVNILNDKGIVNDPTYNGKIDLKINIDFKPTEINATFLSNNYTMDFDEEIEDIFSIRNIGGETAKNIKITSNWIFVSTNNFDLDAGKTKNIAYTVKPFIISTDQTNKTYNEIITITGNFPTIEKNISIFINYEHISEDYANTTINDEIIGYLIEKYCEDHPDDDVCQRKVIKIVNESDRTISYNTTEADWNKIWNFQFEEAENSREFENWVKEYMYENNLTMSDIISNQTGVYDAIAEVSKKLENQNSMVIFVAIFFGFLFCGGILTFLIMNEKSRNKLKNLFSKGELKW